MSREMARYRTDPPAHGHARDSLELASLASSTPPSRRSSLSSSPSGAPSSRKLSFDNDDPLHSPLPQRPGHARRNYSISSAFDFAPPLLPLSGAGGYTSLAASAVDPLSIGENASLERNKTLTYFNGVSLVIGLIIGSGIFSAPSQVNANAGSRGASLVVWAFAGILAWTGAASYAELGGAIPLNGGSQTYLTKIYGDLAGFLFSWCSVCVMKPGGAAIIAIILGEYITRAVVGPEAADVSTLINKAVAVGALVLVTLLNALSTKAATGAANLFLIFKFVALLSITIIGVVVASTGFSWNGNPSTDWKTSGWLEGTSSDLSKLAVALYAALWAFDGWDTCTYVTGELVNPSRDLPRIIHTAMPLVIISYLFANTAYFLVLPLQITSTSTTIAVAMGSQVFGAAGAIGLALIVSGSAFGALNASTFTSGRLFYAAAKEGYLPGVFGTLGFNDKRPVGRTRQRDVPGLRGIMLRLCSDDTTDGLLYTPMAALLLNLSLTTFYVIIGSFGTLITFYGVAGYSFYFLTVLGLLMLRVKEPHLERPYRCWITTPIIFCCVSLFLLSRSVVAQPFSSLAVMGFVVLGVLIYLILVRSGSRERQLSNIDWRFWKRWDRS